MKRNPNYGVPFLLSIFFAILSGKNIEYTKHKVFSLQKALALVYFLG